MTFLLLDWLIDRRIRTNKNKDFCLKNTIPHWTNKKEREISPIISLPSNILEHHLSIISQIFFHFLFIILLLLFHAIIMTAIKRVLEACPHEYYSKQMPFGSNSRITLSPDAMYEVWLFWCAYLFPRKAISLYKRNCQAADLSSCATYLLDHCFLNGSTLRAYTLELD